MNQKVKAWLELIRFNKPIGFYLLLWPTLWALLLVAKGYPSLWNIIVFTLGVFLTRSAGCAINDYADRNFDPLVLRTNQRPLATGLLSGKVAIWTFISMMGVAFLLVLTLNLQTIKLSLIGLMLAFLYPFSKRFIPCPQLVLGFAFSWSIPMAYSAEIGTTNLNGWVLFLANCCWIIAYDTQYAMVDREDDLKIGIKSTAIWFGVWDKFIIAILHILFILLLLSVGLLNHVNYFYYIGLLVATFLLIRQNYLIKSRSPALCFIAFKNNHYVGLVIFLAILMSYIL